VGGLKPHIRIYLQNILALSGQESLAQVGHLMIVDRRDLVIEKRFCVVHQWLQTGSHQHYRSTTPGFPFFGGVCSDNDGNDLGLTMKGCSCLGSVFYRHQFTKRTTLIVII
jgi:hypothetical protein